MKPLLDEPALCDASPAGIRRFLRDVLDAMPLIEREYHHLDHSMPLTELLVQRVSETTDPGDRVLLIGGNAVLGSALIHMGYDLDVWQFPNTLVSEEMRPRAQPVCLEALEAQQAPEGEYATVVVPFVLESLQGDLVCFLRGLRRSLVPGGALVVATGNPARLSSRAGALTGRSTRRATPHLSLTWPALPVHRELHRDELVEAARESGFGVEGSEYVDADRLFWELDSFRLEEWLPRKISHLAPTVAPSLRDTLVLQLRSRAAGRWDQDEERTVSVVVACAGGGEALAQTLAALAEQTYPRSLLDVIVIHDGRAEVAGVVAAARGALTIREQVEANPEGPEARNRAMQDACGVIIGHTDDLSVVPADWVEAAVKLFDADTGMVSGPVIALPGSHPRFLELPGIRPEPTDGDLWRDDLYPVSNVFFRADVARALGGYAEGTRRGAAGVAPLGWDAELGWRLQRAGWQARFREEVRNFRRFPAPPDWKAHAFQQGRALPGLYRRVPETVGRKTMLRGLVASRETLYFNLAFLGAAAVLLRRSLLPFALVLPWLSLVAKRLDYWPPSSWRPSLRLAVKMGLLHLLWLGGLIVGSIRARRPVL